MAIYGLLAFIDTPKPQRKGRKRYIAVSFVITVLRALSGSLDVANYFQILFKSTSPVDWQELMLLKFYKGWKHLFASAGVALVLMIGNALLVSVIP